MSVKVKAIDIGKTKSAATVIFSALRKSIVDGDVVAGEPLRQDELAKLFNTSRLPVREALTMLEQQGLVKTERYKGAVVAALSISEAAEIFDFRALVEAEVMRNAVPLMTHAVLEEAEAAIEAFAQVVDPMEYGDLNRAFHETLYRASAQKFHLQMIGNGIDRIDRYVRAQLVMGSGLKQADEEHRAILAACRARDAELAAQLTAHHILSAKRALERFLIEGPDQA